MKKDKSRIRISLEKWTLRNLYEILDFAENKMIKEFPVSANIFTKWTAMLDAIPTIRGSIVDALSPKPQKQKKEEKNEY